MKCTILRISSSVTAQRYSSTPSLLALGTYGPVSTDLASNYTEAEYNFEPKVALDRMYYDPTDTLFIRHLDLIDRMNMLAREP